MTIELPKMKQVWGVSVTPTTYSESVQAIMALAKARQSAAIDYMPVHGLMLATEDESFKLANQQFDMVCSDGQPVRWALNYFHKTNLSSTVSGPIIYL